MKKDARFHYSGEGSRQFWERVNRITPKGVHSVLYIAGCGLQEHENRMHQALQEAEDNMKVQRAKRTKPQP
jgi:hypothetical protein